jgi:thymidylate kinase
MLNIIQRLVDELNAAGLTYCHWKSNMALPASLAGQTDLDLLLRPASADAFEVVMRRLGFRQTDMQSTEPFPEMAHYFGLDEQSDVLVHVHVYYAVITGESLAKNYRLPLEDMLFENLREQDGMRVPTKSAELVIFTLRMMLKHTSLIELALLAREWSKIKQEATWLIERGTVSESLGLVRRWLPTIDPRLFSRCVAALRGRGTTLNRIRLAFRLRARLQMYARQSVFRSALTGMRKFTGMLARRLTGARTGMVLRSGGVVVAFVGPEATGKSTLLGETRRWLGEHFVVEQVHAGKPKSTALSALPNLAVPLLRSLLPRYRSGNVEVEYAATDLSDEAGKRYPLIFGVRSVLLGYDRRALLNRARGRAAKGAIVLCDRYPSDGPGATDSAQLSRLDGAGRSSVRHLLSRAEKRLYDDIPAPDLVISLSVPLEVAIARNRARGKEEPEDFVRRRHAESALVRFENSPVFSVCTDQPLDQTVSAIKKAIWQVL